MATTGAAKPIAISAPTPKATFYGMQQQEAEGLIIGRSILARSASYEGTERAACLSKTPPVLGWMRQAARSASGGVNSGCAVSEVAVPTIEAEPEVQPELVAATTTDE
jgi:hypothetical protein